MAGIFIDVKLAPDVAKDPEAGRKLAEACPVDIFHASDAGVEIVGVHAPEFSFEADVDNIVEAAADLGVTWPIALDTDKRNFHRWQEGPTGYWPRVYLIDEDNQIRLDQRGDGAHHYRRLYGYVERLLAGEA